MKDRKQKKNDGKSWRNFNHPHRTSKVRLPDVRCLERTITTIHGWFFLTGPSFQVPRDKNFSRGKMMHRLLLWNGKLPQWSEKTPPENEQKCSLKKMPIWKKRSPSNRPYFSGKRFFLVFGGAMSPNHHFSGPRTCWLVSRRFTIDPQTSADISDMLEKVVPIPIQNQDTNRSRATCIFEEAQGDMKPDFFKGCFRYSRCSWVSNWRYWKILNNIQSGPSFGTRNKFPPIKFRLNTEG